MPGLSALPAPPLPAVTAKLTNGPCACMHTCAYTYLSPCLYHCKCPGDMACVDAITLPVIELCSICLYIGYKPELVVKDVACTLLMLVLHA